MPVPTGTNEKRRIPNKIDFVADFLCSFSFISKETTLVLKDCTHLAETTNLRLNLS